MRGHVRGCEEESWASVDFDVPIGDLTREIVDAHVRRSGWAVELSVAGRYVQHEHARYGRIRLPWDGDPLGCYVTMSLRELSEACGTTPLDVLSDIRIGHVRGLLRDRGLVDDGAGHHDFDIWPAGYGGIAVRFRRPIPGEADRLNIWLAALWRDAGGPSDEFPLETIGPWTDWRAWADDVATRWRGTATGCRTG